MADLDPAVPAVPDVRAVRGVRGVRAGSPQVHRGESDQQHDLVGANLLRAAGDVLANEGPNALTVRRIAQVAGVSTMNVYSRFGGKDGVVEHLYIEGFTRLRDALDRPGATDDPMGDLRNCGDGYRRFALEFPTFYSVMFDGAVDYEPSPHAVEHASGTLQLLADRLQRAMDAGLLAPDDPMVTAATVWAACHGVVSLERKQVGPPLLDWAAVYRRTMSALMIGLASGTGALDISPIARRD